MCLIHGRQSGLLYVDSTEQSQASVTLSDVTYSILPRERSRYRRFARYLEIAIFLGTFAYLFYGNVAGFAEYAWATITGKGFIEDFKTPIAAKEYYKSVLAVIWSLVSFFTLWEIVLLIVRLTRDGGPVVGGRTAGSAARVRHAFTEFAQRYQPTFLAGLLLEFVPKFIVIDIFWILWPHFKHFALFETNFEWYSWVYAVLAWDLSTWVWHFGAHRVRLLWCLHAPHHTPQELNMTAAWVHFFAEGYYTAVLQVALLMIMGVRPEMLLIIMSFEVSWGTFIHAGERSFKHGRLGFLQYLVITPSHHRAHHAKNPLYMDTNFCTLLPFWDWIFGTLQPLRNEVKPVYGITRSPDVTRFLDFYFGECLSLIRDLKLTPGLKNKVLLMIKPPGWAPDSDAMTARVIRQTFLSENPQLGLLTPRAMFRHPTA